MRLPFTKIWRAFPELDRFSDAQCERFVAAAGGWVPRIVQFFAVMISIPVLLFAYFQLLFALPNWWSSGGEGEWTVIGAAVVFGLSLVVGMAARDRVLRQRVKEVMRAGSTCAGCHYSILGLPVSEETKVRCPECGLEATVNPAIGELVIDSHGNVATRADGPSQD